MAAPEEITFIVFNVFEIDEDSEDSERLERKSRSVLLESVEVFLEWGANIHLCIGHHWSPKPFTRHWAQELKEEAAREGVDRENISVTHDISNFCQQHGMQQPTPGSILISRIHRGRDRDYTLDLSNLIGLDRRDLRRNLYTTRVFISYDWRTWQDKSAIFYLQTCIRNLGMLCFVDERNLEPLGNLQQQLAEQLAQCDIVLCLVSAEYNRKLHTDGTWIKTEVETAWRRFNAEGQTGRLLPIHVDDFSETLRNLPQDERLLYDFHLGQVFTPRHIKTRIPTEGDQEDIMELARAVFEQANQL